MNRVAVVIAAALLITACGAPQPRPRTVAELKADPLVLQGLVARCVADKRAAARDIECSNARLAIDQLGGMQDREQSSERGAEFDRVREQHRQREEQQKRSAASPAFDPYSAPVAQDRPPSGDDPH